MSRVLIQYAGVASVFSWMLLLGCTDLPGVNPAKTSRREINQEMTNRVLDGLSVNEFVGACGSLAGDLSSSSIVQEASGPIVIEIQRLEDWSAPELRPVPQIYAAAIRENLINANHKMIAFRDKRVCDELYVDAISPSFGTPAKQNEIDARLGQLAKVDYWLTGFIYCQDEVNAANRHLYRYYRVHFLMTDVETGLVAWEKHYEVKNEGVLLSWRP